MDKGYEGFCLNDSWFYDSPTAGRDDDVDFPDAHRALPPGWQRDEFEDWVALTPPDHRLVPKQGWKIHASGTLGNAERLLEVVRDYCWGHEIAFKFVRSAQLLLLANSKYANRSSSGKFVTIYPRDETELAQTLRELGGLLEGFDGPYILSDVRWRSGPLYVRYGGFAERFCLGESGELAPAIEDPQGRLVPDRRGFTFSVPPWVEVPTFLEEAIAARSAVAVSDLPYRIERALHFSNGGGVYVATDLRDGASVVLKEARPHAGLAVDGSDAVERLHNERRMLERLDGLGVAPAVRDFMTFGGHEFLVEEFVNAVPLARLMVDRYPLALLEDGEASCAEYTDWAVAQVERLAETVEKVHERGIVIGDLHPQNVLVHSSGDIVLVDLEVACDVESGKTPSLADPAFAAPGHLRGFAIDTFALACITVSMFVPLTELLALDPAKIHEFARICTDRFPVPRDLVGRTVGVIVEGLGDERTERPRTARSNGAVDCADRGLPYSFDDPTSRWPVLRDSLVHAILHSATPERDDRLFPGDVAQFDSGGLSLAFGAAGVLLALAQAGGGRWPEHEDWLVRHALDPQPGTRFGFYDGLCGVAYALDLLGLELDARRVLDIALDALGDSWQGLSADLLGGVSGVGLTLVHFAHSTGDPALWRRASQMAQFVADGLEESDEVSEISGPASGFAGLTRGASGPALFFLRLYERAEDDVLLDLAETALRQDLHRCVLRDDGALEVNEGYRTMPYLHDGSIGIGLVLDVIAERRPMPDLLDASRSIRTAATSEFYIESGLFSGRAGMMAYLARNPDDAVLVDRHVRRLSWHAVNFDGHLAFPGDQLLRLSMDYATGSAGVLLALAAAHQQPSATLPFLGPLAGGSPIPAYGRR